MQSGILGGRNYFHLSLAIQRKFKEALTHEPLDEFAQASI